VIIFKCTNPLGKELIKDKYYLSISGKNDALISITNEQGNNYFYDKSRFIYIDSINKRFVNVLNGFLNKINKGV
jgi:hypothetical protein